MSIGHSAGTRPIGRRYSMAQHGASQAGSDYGHRLLQPHVAARYMIQKPLYKQGYTTLRIFPGKEPDGTLTPYRFGAGPLQYGDWIRRYDMMVAVGTSLPLTYITHDRAEDGVDPRTRIRMHPAAKLRVYVDTQIRLGQEETGWAMLVQDPPDHQRGPALPWPSEQSLVFCACFYRGNKQFSPPEGGAIDQRGLIFTLPKGGTNKFFDELDKPNPAYAGDPSNYAESLLHGDPIALDHGKFVTFFAKKNDPRRSPQQAAIWATQAGGRQEREEAGYDCDIQPLFGAIPPQMNAPHLRDLVLHHVQPWDQILWFPSYEEQAHMLALQFPPNLICRAWADNPEWIPIEVRNRTTMLHNRGAVGAPPAGYMGPWGQAPGGMPPAGPGDGLGRYPGYEQQMLPYGSQPDANPGYPQGTQFGYPAPGTQAQPDQAPWGGPAPYQPPVQQPQQPQPYPGQGYPVQQPAGYPPNQLQQPGDYPPTQPIAAPPSQVQAVTGWGPPPAAAAPAPQVDETLARHSMPPPGQYPPGQPQASYPQQAPQAAPVRQPGFGVPAGYPTGVQQAPPPGPAPAPSQGAPAVSMPPAGQSPPVSPFGGVAPGQPVYQPPAQIPGQPAAPYSPAVASALDAARLVAGRRN
jgi:hypothetical protein